MSYVIGRVWDKWGVEAYYGGLKDVWWSDFAHGDVTRYENEEEALAMAAELGGGGAAGDGGCVIYYDVMEVV